MTGQVEELGPEAPYTITLKGGSGYAAPWLVLRAQSAEDAQALLVEAKAAELLESIAAYASDFQEKVAGAEPANTSAPAGGRSTGSPSRSGARGGSQRGGSAPAPKNGEVELHPEGLKCEKAGCGGDVQLKTITSKKNGKKYDMWVCPNQQDRNDGHHSEFIN